MFSQFKGTTRESSYNFKIRSDFQGILGDHSLECRVAGPWLLSKTHWLKQMMDQRELNKEMYFSRFPPTITSLKNYLNNGPIQDVNQILFLVLEKSDILHGHAGFKLDSFGCMNLDNVLRITNGPTGIMKIVLNEILNWGNKILNVSEFTLKVISTNTKAITLYKKLGFYEHKVVNLRTKELPNGIMSLVPIEKNHSNTIEKMIIMKIKI
jgi:hypothetical protein